ncbi:MAG: YfcC family protein [Tenericutes bacterium]|nr:YfcC family protein [Mycoplasmatota bacterium]
MARTKKKKFVLTSFSIIFIIIVLLGIISHLLPKASFVGEDIVNGSGVVGAKISDILSAPILGFQDAADVCIFILVLGGLLAIVTKTGALETGIKVLVKKLKGRELILIPILMLIFSIGGTTYGMMEETVAFYGLLAFTMVAAGMDTIVASATVLLGAGVGVLGSTINPFAVGAAISALPEGIKVNQGITIGLGVALWIVSYIIAVLFVLNYAKKVKADKGSTFLSLQEQKAMDKAFAKEDYLNTDAKLTTRQKIVLWLFGLTFVVMIIGFIPWVDFGVIPASVADAGTHFSAFLTGNCFGYWWFLDGAVWFFVMAIIIGIVGKLKEHELVEAFIEGASDILSVVLIIAVARGASVLMKTTYLDNYIIYNAAEALKGTPAVVFAPLNYLLHVGLSFLVPSSSGLASLSTPIMGPLAYQLGFSVETNIMILVAANGLVNLITPTCGAIMGGLALARVDYSTWFKWSIKVVLTIALASMVILTLAMVAL